MGQRSTEAVILAAGLGTRMHSRLPKALHALAGLPLVEHVRRLVEALDLGRPWVVVGHGREAVERTLSGRAYFVVQDSMRGTGDAVAKALAQAEAAEHLLVLYADCPLVPVDLVERLMEVHERSGLAATLITAWMQEPSGYGRMVRDGGGALCAIVEEKEATSEERAIHEINSGIGVWRRDALQQVLKDLPWHGQERYLTDAVSLLLERGHAVGTLLADDPEVVMGINTRQQLAAAEASFRAAMVEKLWAAGVTVVDPATTWVDADVEVGQDTVIYPMTFLKGKTRVGRNCRIGPMATLVDSELEDGVAVGPSVVEGSHLASDVDVGPFNHLRPGTRVDEAAHIGNFVELKNTHFGEEAKAGHHSYLGDATIGRRVNIGAGTVIVNYDGIAKHSTSIGDDAFIGCNANLVAPLQVGVDAFVAAGSTITEAVPDQALAIARARQVQKAGWTKRRRASTPQQKGRDQGP